MFITFITSEGGDWIAMYINGSKVAEGHSLSEQEVVNQISKFTPITQNRFELGQDRAESEGFPNAIDQAYLGNLNMESHHRELKYLQEEEGRYASDR